MGVETPSRCVSFQAECRQENSIHPAACLDFISAEMYVHRFAGQVYTFRARLKECFFSQGRLDHAWVVDLFGNL